MVSFFIEPDECKACMICLRKCPSQAIAGGKKLIHVIDQDVCNGCGICQEVFENDASFCIHCGLYVRYCAEVKQLNAVGFIDRGVNEQISFLPEIATKECGSCKECFPLCPTSYLQAAFVLVQGLARPG